MLGQTQLNVLQKETRWIPLKIFYVFLSNHYVIKLEFAKIDFWAYANVRICSPFAFFRPVFSFLSTPFSGEEDSWIYYGYVADKP